ncbi:MAG: alpha/beta hydrolase family protein [Janthinobacterium lividum]
MRYRLRTALLFCLSLVAPFTHVPLAAQKNPPAMMQGKVGIVTRSFVPTQRRNWRGAESHVLETTIWYPAVEAATETRQVVGPSESPLFEAGSAMPHAAFAPSLGKFPLILLSHGTGGSAEQMAWLGTALARAGYVAAAVDHPGNNSHAAVTAEGFALWWERATDLSEVLDGLLADPELGSHIDRDRVGAAGFSLGGYTVLELAGARTDIAAFYDRCHKGADDAVCHVPEMRDTGAPEQILAAVRKTSGESLARSGDSYRDPRVRAVFVIAPALGFALTPESLKAIRLPVDLVAGAADAIAPPVENADLVRKGVRGARETVMPGVGHYTFLDTCTTAGKQQLALYCADAAGVDREAVHQQVDAMAVPFFDRALR